MEYVWFTVICAALAAPFVPLFRNLTLAVRDLVKERRNAP